jgi:hypothetical protein
VCISGKRLDVVWLECVAGCVDPSFKALRVDLGPVVVQEHPDPVKRPLDEAKVRRVDRPRDEVVTKENRDLVAIAGAVTLGHRGDAGLRVAVSRLRLLDVIRRLVKVYQIVGAHARDARDAALAVTFGTMPFAPAKGPFTQ